MNSEYFIPISLEVLKRFDKKLLFDIYVRRSESKYTKIFRESEALDWERVELYKSQGVDTFFVTKDDYQKYSLVVRKLGDLLNKVDGRFPTEEAINILKEMILFTMREISFVQKLSHAVIESAGIVVQQSIKILLNDQSQIMGLIKAMANTPQMFKHSIMTSIFSIILAKEIGIESKDNLYIIGMGAFLHDVGQTQLTFDPDDKEILSPDERKELWRHPQLGKEMLDEVKGIRQEVVQIVMQHHEQPNGHGYPNGLKTDEIYPPAKIVAIADNFSSLITKQSWRPGYAVSEAIHLMASDIGKFDKHLLRAFAKLFKVQI
ncbi:MAG: HD domain-containing protein [Halobacteriovoraceae bacterium]|nr:HD domain-containing protein [Halobacteriovoraceae bacterium]